MDDALLLDLAIDKAAEAQALARRVQLVVRVERGARGHHSNALRMAVEATDLEVFARDRAEAIANPDARRAAMKRVWRATVQVDRAMQALTELSPGRSRVHVRRTR